MLAIARALMSRPRLLLLDEPSLGLAPLIVKQIFGVIREINERQNMTVLLVEQNAHHALRLAHRGYVMQTGRITLSGTGRELLADPEVRDGIKEFSSWPTIPQLYVNGEFVGGCDIVTELEQNGELSPLLKG